LTNLLCHAARVYHGVWGSAPFQSLYERAPGPLGSLVMMPEWYLVLGFLLLLGGLEPLWRPFWTAWPVFVVAAGLSLGQAIIRIRHAWLGNPTRSAWFNLR